MRSKGSAALIIKRIFRNFDIMTRLTVDIDNSKSEKLLLEVLTALGLPYKVEHTGNEAVTEKPFNKAELAMYKRLKKSFEQIKLHQEGKIKLKTIEEVLAELS
jgi:hypothetical protein